MLPQISVVTQFVGVLTELVSTEWRQNLFAEFVCPAIVKNVRMYKDWGAEWANQSLRNDRLPWALHLVP